jgi:hypothetical protein
MGVTRPNPRQYAYTAKLAEETWTKHLKAKEPKRAGYDKDMVRKTCDNCLNLTWHDRGKCTECEVGL